MRGGEVEVDEEMLRVDEERGEKRRPQHQHEGWTRVQTATTTKTAATTKTTTAAAMKTTISKCQPTTYDTNITISEWHTITMMMYTVAAILS